MAFHRFWQGWLRIARVIGNIQARVFFTLFYLLPLLIVGVLFRLLSDPLRLHKESFKGKKTAFIAWEHPREGLDDARKPY